MTDENRKQIVLFRIDNTTNTLNKLPKAAYPSPNYDAKYTMITDLIAQRYDSLGVPYSAQNHRGDGSFYKEPDPDVITLPDPAAPTYYYHSDHLGSSSLITDQTATPVQHLQYLPYGEVFIDQRAISSTWGTPYKFNGKEQDEETGLYYYGARYLDPRTSVWLSVDPLAEKYPSISPYVYCAGNPVKYVDPDGRFSTKFGAWMYKQFNGGGQTLKDAASGEYFVSNQVKYNGSEFGTAVSRTFDWGGRNTAFQNQQKKAQCTKYSIGKMADITQTK